VIFTISAEYFSQRVQCTREDKEECLQTVRQLLELAFEAQEHGLLAMEELVADQTRFPDRFLRKAVELVVEISDPEKIRKVLYNLIITTKYVANNHFLKDMLITETMLAVSQSEDLDYVFAHLIPSYFGLDYAPKAEEVYRSYKISRVRERKFLIRLTEPKADTNEERKEGTDHG